MSASLCFCYLSVERSVDDASFNIKMKGFYVIKIESNEQNNIFRKNQFKMKTSGYG
jgi:hypothetical protein